MYIVFSAQDTLSENEPKMQNDAIKCIKKLGHFH